MRGKNQGQGGGKPAARLRAGYCIEAAHGGEPPGRWWGDRRETLGFKWMAGGTTRFTSKSNLGPGKGSADACGNYARFEDHHARFLAAKPTRRQSAGWNWNARQRKPPASQRRTPT